MLITETLDWRDIVNKMPISPVRTLASYCNVKSYNKTSKRLTLKINVNNARIVIDTSLEDLERAIYDITGINISVTIKLSESGEITGKRKHTLND
jgi:hypothetical protein